MYLDNIKTLIGLDTNDTSKDAILDILITHVENSVKSYLKLSAIPAELDWTIEAMTVENYNRRGSEGISNESVEGVSYTYEDVFSKYERHFDVYLQSNTTNRVRML
jgi:Phage gp6-like head-tail connector protein